MRHTLVVLLLRLRLRCEKCVREVGGSVSAGTHAALFNPSHILLARLRRGGERRVQLQIVVIAEYWTINVVSPRQS